MSIFDDIRKDAGTLEEWRAEQPHFANGWWVVFTDPDTDATVDESGDGGFDERTARRIARVPQLEAIALAALDPDWIAQRIREIDGKHTKGAGQIGEELAAAFRKATE